MIRYISTAIVFAYEFWFAHSLGQTATGWCGSHIQALPTGNAIAAMGWACILLGLWSTIYIVPLLVLFVGFIKTEKGVK